MSWNNWLAGQTWSNFQDVAALPDAVDFVGPTDGTIFVRQAQVRYTNGPWSFSAENPQTTITPFQRQHALSTAGDNVRCRTSPRAGPTKGDWGHFTVAGLVRQFKYRRSVDRTTPTPAAAVSVSGKFNLGKSDDIRYMVNAGSGIGRYLGLRPGQRRGAGRQRRPARRSTATAASSPGATSSRPKLRSNLMYSAAQFDNDMALTGFGVTERAQSVARQPDLLAVARSSTSAPS